MQASIALDRFGLPLFSLPLAHPIFLCHRLPAGTHRVVLPPRKQAGLQEPEILLEATGLHRADDGRVDPRHGQRKTQGRAGRWPGVAAKNAIVQRAQPHPVGSDIRAIRFGVIFPGRIRERPFGNDPKTVLTSRGQDLVQRFLISEIDRNLQRIKCTGLDRVRRGLAIAAVPKVPQPPEPAATP